MVNSRKERGIEAECLACNYLEARGMVYLKRNVRTR